MSRIYDNDEPGAWTDTFEGLDIHKKYRYGEYEGLYIQDDDGEIDAWFWSEESAVIFAKKILKYLGEGGKYPLNYEKDKSK